MGAIDKIAGGFVAIPVADVLRAWRACQSRPLGIGGFRAWLALREMAARRRAIGDRCPSYGVGELARLLDVSERTAATSVRRLVAAGLVEWSPERIAFPGSDLGFEPDLVDTIGRGRGVVAIPRRLLRWIARGARPALVATVLAALLRCVSRRRSGWRPWGRLASSWVATVFGVDLRRVKAARAELVALGWLAPVESPGWTVRRWGAAWTVDLDWGGPRPDADCHRSAASDGACLPPPRSDLDPLPERKTNPDPARSGPAGARVEQDGANPPTLRDVRPIDLATTARVLELHRQAVASGRIGSSEAERLRFVAAVEHARSVGKANPPGLFVAILRGGRWGLLTQSDEDRARRRLRDHERPAPAPSATTRPPAPPSASPALRSPYLGAERPKREPTALASLLGRLVVPLGT